MKTSIKWGLTTLMVVGAGLLLGGNAIAESEEVQVTAVAEGITQDQINLYEEQARLLADQIQDYLAAQQPTENAVAEKKELTQAELDAIEIVVKDVAAKTEVLKVEVERFVAIRTITEKIASLKSQVVELKMAEVSEEAAAVQNPEIASQTDYEAPVAVTGSETVSETVLPEEDMQISETVETNVEAQIASIKAQIKDLTAQYEVQKAAEETAAQMQAEVENIPEVECEGGVCSANIDTAVTDVETTETASNKGFWQTVSDFLKNLFTF